ncbi:MAG: prepilin-type N-terminal cleavage/methylation domain-containing protein [Phycisphaerales bacterium]
MITLLIRHNRRRGFTITELLVVMGLIVLLIGILLPALAAVKSGGLMTKSMANMRQIATWMRLYSTDNREFIVPSQFDYSYPDCPGCYRGKVRSIITAGRGVEHEGTWSDILWTVYEVARFPGAVEASGHDYSFDSPDIVLYDILGEDVENPFRSAAQNTGRILGGTGATPFGTGAQQRGRPGFFAANDFFDARPDGDGKQRWFTNAQIKVPEQSMYLVDSFYGEVIPDEPEPFDRDPTLSPPTLQVDFRYAGETCLMLFMDGHVGPQGIWKNLNDLQGDPTDPQDHGRGIRIQNLTQN